VKKNLWIKIASVVFAIALWVFVISRGYSDFTLTTHVGYVNLPAGVQVADGSSTKEVAIGVRGHERVVKSMGAEDVQVTVNLDGLELGPHQITIDKEDVKLPIFVRLMSVTPSVFEVTLEEAAEKSVPVKPYIVGNPKKGYERRGMKVSPGNVNVTGGKSALGKLSWVKTDPVDIEGASDSISTEARVALPGDGMRAEPESVTVEITIEKVR
jgi:YbbR domain-containing protein